MNLKLKHDNAPTPEFDHSGYLDKLWTFYKDGGFGIRKRSEIEQRIQLLTLRIFSSMKQQTRIVRIDALTQKPVMLRYTQLKGRAEVLQPDSIGFLRHFEELKNHLDRTPLPSRIDMLSISKICMESFEQSPLNSYGGEIMIELTVHADHESLFDACAITSMVIAYAMECTSDAGHLSGSLDVLEHYDSDVFGHPLS